MDLAVSFPNPGVIRLQSRELFHDPDGPSCRRFLERVFQADEITGVALKGGNVPAADLTFCPRTHSLRDVVRQVASFLRITANADAEPVVHESASASTWPDMAMRPRAGLNGAA